MEELKKDIKNSRYEDKIFQIKEFACLRGSFTLKFTCKLAKVEIFLIKEKIFIFTR